VINLRFSKPLYMELTGFQKFLEEKPARGNIFRYFIESLSEFTKLDLEKNNISIDKLGNFFNDFTRRAYGVKVSISEINKKTGCSKSEIQNIIRDFENYESGVVLKIRSRNIDGGHSANYYFVSPSLLVQNKDLGKIIRLG